MLDARENHDGEVAYIRPHVAIEAYHTHPLADHVFPRLEECISCSRPRLQAHQERDESSDCRLAVRGLRERLQERCRELVSERREPRGQAGDLLKMCIPYAALNQGAGRTIWIGLPFSTRSTALSHSRSAMETVSSSQ